MENTNLTRKQQKIFAGNTTVSEEQIAVFGSKTQTGTMAFSKDPDIIQNENWQNGWQNATVLEEAPFEEDFNAISFVNSYNTAYLLQKGIPEYSASTTYFKGSICLLIDNDGNPTLYYSKTDNNTGNNPATDSANWSNLYSYILSLINNNFVKLDGSNAEFNNLSANAKENILSSVLGSLQTEDETKIGYIKFFDTTSTTTSIILPEGGTFMCSFSSYGGAGNTLLNGSLCKYGLYAGGTTFNSTQGSLAICGWYLKIQ